MINVDDVSVDVFDWAMFRLSGVIFVLLIFIALYILVVDVKGGVFRAFEPDKDDSLNFKLVAIETTLLVINVEEEE